MSLVAECRQGRRSRPGNAGQGVGQAVLLPAGHQPQGVALHHPAQRVLFADAQARARGAGQRRRDDRHGVAVHPSQHGSMDLGDFRKALEQLPEDQREAIILIGASGFSYEEAAEICECAVGTIKSRVSRARTPAAGTVERVGRGRLRPGFDRRAGDGLKRRLIPAGPAALASPLRRWRSIRVGRRHRACRRPAAWKRLEQALVVRIAGGEDERDIAAPAASGRIRWSDSPASITSRIGDVDSRGPRQAGRPVP